MFLVDSSAWIEYLRPAGASAVKSRVREAVRKTEAVCCGIVVVEVLRGARNEHDFELLRASLMSLPQLPIDEAVVERAARWGFLLDRRGQPVSTTDLLIASAAFGKAGVLHLDKDFETIASLVDLQQENLAGR